MVDSPGWILTTPLPKAVAGVKGVTVGGRLFMTGKLRWAVYNIQIFCVAGGGEEIIAWLDEEQEWKATCKMKKARSHHAVTTIQMDDQAMEH